MVADLKGLLSVPRLVVKIGSALLIASGMMWRSATPIAMGTTVSAKAAVLSDWQHSGKGLRREVLMALRCRGELRVLDESWP